MSKKTSDHKKREQVNPGTKLKIPPRRPVWNIWQVLFLVLLINLIEFPLGWLQTPQDLDQMQGFFRFLGVGLGEGILYLIGIFIFQKLIKRPVRELGFVPARFGFMILGLFAGIFLFVCVGLLGNFLARVLGTPAPQSFTLVVKGAEHTWQFVLLLLLGGIIAPLKEETLFRGLVYPPLRQDYGRGKGIIFTALFFAGLHFDLIRFLPLFIGGIVLTWLYERTGSLWPAIIAHGTWNIIMALALWIQR